MNDTELYSKILGIEEPWQVVSVTLKLEEVSVFVTLDLDSSPQEFLCPVCNNPAKFYDRRPSRTWRHLDSCQFQCQFQTFLVASLPRVCCPVHGIVTASVFFAEPHSRFTLLFERFAIQVLQATKVQTKAASLLRLTPGQVHDLMERAVVRGLQRRSENNSCLNHLSIDEKVSRPVISAGHQYVSVLSDPVGKRVLDVVEGRTADSVQQLFMRAIPSQQRSEVRSVSMDMWSAFLKARENVFPQAATVHDRYHIAAYLNEAVDKTRRAENRELTRQRDNRLVKTKYLWLRSDSTMTEKQRAALEGLSCLELETAKVWAFKESFREFFACVAIDEAWDFLKSWYEAAVALGNMHLSKVAQMLWNHQAGIIREGFLHILPIV